MEKTETDLSSLFERRKASQTSPSQPSQSQMRNFPTRLSQPSSQPSRSLNDLLGIRRTPIERFRSPHEQRPTPRPIQIPEESRPAKRQRTVPSQPAQRPAVIDLSGPSSVRAPTAKEPTKPTSRPERAQPPQPPPTAPNRPTPTPPITQPRAGKVPEEPSPASIRPTPAQPATVQPRRNPPPVSARLTPTPTTSHVTRSEQTQTSENARPSAHSSFSSDSTAATPRNTLQLSREKPRKKLMYRALLPDQADASETWPSEQREPQSVCDNVDSREDGTNRFREAAKPVDPGPVSTDVQMTSGDSTLDVLAEMIEDSPFESDVENETNAVKESSNQATKPALLKNNLPRPAPPDPCPEIPPAAVNHAARSKAFPPTPAKQSSRGFQKSYSDPSAFHTVNSIQSRQLPSSTLELLAEDSDEDEERDEEQTRDQVQEQGPWTAEALDLFDFWPPERPRPG